MSHGKIWGKGHIRQNKGQEQRPQEVMSFTGL